MSDLSRRGFLKGAVLAAGAGAVAGLTGCAPSEAGTTAGSQQVAAGDVQWDEEFDVVVVGAGLAGTSAAVALVLEGNGETCLLLEKSDNPLGGGNSAVSGGGVAWTDSEHRDGCLEYWKELRDPFTTTPDDVLEAHVDYMCTMLDFLKRAGAKDEDMSLIEPGTAHVHVENDTIENHSSGDAASFPEYPELESSQNVGMVRFCGDEMKTVAIFMLSAVEAHPDVITMKTGAALTGLIQDPETKAILGAVYEKDGDSVYVKANKGVIMCLGGFERNPEMLQDYLSLTTGHHLGGEYNTGDGFKICAEVGAKFWHMNSVAGTWNGAVKIDGSMHAGWFLLGREKGITVGLHGRRYYMDVDHVIYQNWYDYANAEENIVTTTSARHGHYNFGGEWPHVILPATSWFVFDDANKEEAAGKLTDGDLVEEGWAVKADTIEELAELIDVPADELALTVEVWNDCCEKGVDYQFYRAPNWLTSVTQPPFYAVRCEPEFINTDGGPARNAKAQIIGRDGEPIPNLYSSGEFGSIWCNMYQGTGNLSECVNFSRIAVDAILGK